MTTVLPSTPAPELLADLPFPDLATLDARAEEIAQASFRGPNVSQFRRPSIRAYARLTAFYEAIQQVMGVAVAPAPWGVQVSPEDDRRLQVWLKGVYRSPVRATVRDRELAFIYMDRLPSTLGETPAGRMHVTAQAFMNIRQMAATRS